MRALAIIVTAVFVMGMWPAKADDDVAKRLHGVWRLTSLKLRIVGDDPFETDVFGSNPNGYLIFTTEGRMAASRHRSKPPQHQSYTGKYTVEGDKWTTKVDVSWNEVYNSEDQVRYFKLEGDLLSVRTPEQSDVLPGKQAVFALTFARER